MELNPYRAPEPFSQGASHTVDNDITETELVAFAGGIHYPRVLLKLLNGESRHAGFNVWAALFGIQWYFFRKLYSFGLVSASVEIFVPLAAYYVVHSTTDLDYRNWELIVGFVAFVMSRIVIGYMANIALALKAVKVIEAIDKLNKDNETHLRMIKHAGGISVPSLLFVFVILGILRAAVGN